MRTIRANYVRSAIVVACMSVLACGDDEDEGVSDAGSDSGAINAAPDGGDRGPMARGGSGGLGGSAGGSGGSGGRTAAGGSGGAPAAACSEPAPTEPVTCGGETCLAPTDFTNNACIVPCCVEQNGRSVCAAKSTSPMYPAECTLPAMPDPACPPLEAMGNMFQGCCDVALGKCGFISTARPGCITESQFVTLPEPLLDCSGGEDAGTEDAG